MKKHEPELGQMCFGQPWKKFDCSKYLTALLEGIRSMLKIAGGNDYQKEFDPFENWEDAETFNTKHKDLGFEVWPYSWNDDEEQKYNFKWGNIEVSWYKHLGRGMTVNKEVTPVEAADMFDECVKKLSEWQRLYFHQTGHIVGGRRNESKAP